MMDYDDEYETVFPLPFWAVLIAALIILLPGCAAEPTKSPSPRTEVCLLQLLGQTDTGLPVVKQVCVTPEEFAKSQQ